MNDDAFTAEERALLHSWSGYRQVRRSWVGYYLAILTPLIVFAVYGLIKGDVVAVGIAFGGMLLYQLWNISNDFARRDVYRSLMTKIAEREAGRTES